MSFESLKLHPTLLKNLAREGYQTPTPIQREAIPVLLAGRDLIGCAQTGTGKTAAFGLPTIQRLAERPAAGTRCLVLSPTRELASQIAESLTAYAAGTGLRIACVYGGASLSQQARQLKEQPAILVATPGRLLDLLSQRLASLAQVEVLVLDEADRMLDMGFIRDVRRIVSAVPTRRQTLFFSATMAAEVLELAKGMLKDPVRVEVTPPASTVEKIAQHVFHVPQANKRRLLLHLLGDQQAQRVVVFTRTKHGANRVASHLDGAGVSAAAIHGNKSQSARERALASFRDGGARVLVATDIAARGIDVDAVTHVINFDIPEVPESYVHRIGRTARAGASGVALSFCDDAERPLVAAIEKAIRRPLAVAPHPFRGAEASGEAHPRREARPPPDARAPRPSQGVPGRRRRRRR